MDQVIYLEHRTEGENLGKSPPEKAHIILHGSYSLDAFQKVSPIPHMWNIISQTILQA